MARRLSWSWSESGSGSASGSGRRRGRGRRGSWRRRHTRERLFDHPLVRDRVQAGARAASSREARERGPEVRGSVRSDRDLPERDRYPDGVRAALVGSERGDLGLPAAAPQSEQRCDQPAPIRTHHGDEVERRVALRIQLHHEVPAIPDRADGPRRERDESPARRSRVVEPHRLEVEGPAVSFGSVWSVWSAPAGTASATTATTVTATSQFPTRLTGRTSGRTPRTRRSRPRSRARDRGRRAPRAPARIPRRPSERRAGVSSLARHATIATAASARLRTSSSR